MYAFVKITKGPGRAFEAYCKELGKTPREMIEAMVLSFVAEKNMPYPPPEDMGEGLDRFTATYLKMRATKLALKKQFEAEVGEIEAQMEQIETHLLKTLNEAGAKSMNTNSGTFYKQKDFKPSCSDWAVFYKWIAKEDAFQFLEKRVTKSAVEEYMEAHDELPPGISAYESYKVVVRKGQDS